MAQQGPRFLQGAPGTGTASKGFTLIELMIAVAVVGILAAVALPAYNSSIRKSRRTDAKSAILDLASRQERYFSVNNAYATNLTDLGYASGTGQGQVLSGNQSYYTLSLPQASPANSQAYTAQATPTGDQTNDSTCYTYRIDQQGVQSNLNSGGTALTSTGCW